MVQATAPPLDQSVETKHPRDTFEIFFETLEDGSIQVKSEYPQRQSVHDKLLQEVLSKAAPVPPSEKPIAILLVGGPGSGKSSMLKKLESHLSRDYVHIDADYFKMNLPEFKAMSAAGLSGAAMYVHEEGSHLSKVATKEAINNRQNLIFDGTGVNTQKYSNLIKDLQEQGYEVGLLVAQTDVSIGLQRVADRAVRTGRDVPKDFVVECYEKAPKSFVLLKDQVDTFQVFDTTTEPRAVWVKGQGHEQILDSKFVKDYFNYEQSEQLRTNQRAAARSERTGDGRNGPPVSARNGRSGKQAAVRDAVQR